jgi:competence protein ComEC
MINLRNSPFLWISLLLLLSYRVNLDLAGAFPVWLPTLLIGVCCICALLSMLKFNPGTQYKSSIAIGVLIVSAGSIRINEYVNATYHGKLQDESVFTQGVYEVRQVLKNKASSVSLSCRVSTLFDSTQEDISKVFDKNILLFIKTTNAVEFLPGDIIRAEGWLSAIKAPQNPNAFDARLYYNTIGIRHQMYCKQENIMHETGANFSVARMTARWQRFLSNTVRKNMSPQVAQLTNALVWGDRSDMDEEVRDAFADSGAMHVLSVSGMHVAIIYGMLLYILGSPSAGGLPIRITRFILYSILIMLYVGLSGACPAVLRAGLMIMLFLFGKTMGWNTPVWNLLGFAAFVMMWINPFVWQNIGFQLSFLAMAGILLFAKPLIRSLAFKQMLLHKCWEITALSLVAQVFILPILLRQFHQFPLTFILSSIVAIPAAFLVMFGALINIVLSLVGIDFFWPLLDWTGKIFIASMQWMSGLNPLMHFSLPSSGAALLMLMAITFSFSLVFKLPRGRKIAWLCGILTFVSLGCHRISAWSTGNLVIYHSPKGLCIDIIENGRCYSIFDCSLTPGSIEFMTRGYRCEKDIINVENICSTEIYKNNSLDYSNHILKTHFNSICIWNKNNPEESLSELTTHLLLDECPDPDVFKQAILCNSKMLVIIPAHLDRRCRKGVIDFLSENHVNYYDIDTKGYYNLGL